MNTMPMTADHASGAALAATRIADSHSRLVGWWLTSSGVLIGAAVLALSVDRSVALWFKHHRLPGELAHLVRLAEVFAWGGGVALIIATAATLDPRGRRIVPGLAGGSLGAGICADFIKLFIARTRPSATLDSASSVETFVAALPAFNKSSLAGGYGHHLQSFPSAHSATAVGLAIGLSILYPRGRWLFTAFAMLAMFQRIEAGAHYCSDVLAGAALAFVVAAVGTCCWRLPHGCGGNAPQVG
jgi:membrane-associated phospholipid phosphatase